MKIEPAKPCDAALDKLPNTTARTCLRLVTHAIERPEEFKGAPINEIGPERKFILWAGLSALAPKNIDPGAFHRLTEVPGTKYLGVPFVQRWLRALVGVGHGAFVEVIFRRFALDPFVAPSATRWLLERGDKEHAAALAAVIPVTAKWARGMSLLELALADPSGAPDAAVAAVLQEPTITSGPGRGIDELSALVEMLARAVAAGAPPAYASAIAKPLLRLAKEGQRRTRPTAFAKELARASAIAAAGAGADRTDLVAVARALLDGVELADVVPPAPSAIEEAERRVRDGAAAPLRVPTEVDVQPPTLPPDASWRTTDDLGLRVTDASEILAATLDSGDLEAYFDALAIALDPEETHEQRVARWRTADDASYAAFLLDVVKRDPTPDDRWCVRGSHEPWEAIATVWEREVASELVDVLIARDLLSRAYGIDGNFRTPRSIAKHAARMVVVQRRVDLAERIVAHLSSSTRKHVEFRLFDALFELRLLRDFSPWKHALSLPTARRWTAWALVERFGDRGLASLRAELGEPRAEVLNVVCAALARAGRFDDALELARHDLDAHFLSEGWGSVLAPMQGALLAIAAAAPSIDDGRRKRLLRAMRDAPRRPREGHKERLAELEALVARRREEAARAGEDFRADRATILGHTAAAVLFETGVGAGWFSVLAQPGSPASMRLSDGKGFIVGGDDAEVEAAKNALLARARIDFDLGLPTPTDPWGPGEGEVQIHITGIEGGARWIVAAETELEGGFHPASALHSLGHRLLAALFALEKRQLADARARILEGPDDVRLPAILSLLGEPSARAVLVEIALDGSLSAEVRVPVAMALAPTLQREDAARLASQVFAEDAVLLRVCALKLVGQLGLHELASLAEQASTDRATYQEDGRVIEVSDLARTVLGVLGAG